MLDVAEFLIKMTTELRLDTVHIHNVTKKWMRLDQVYMLENTLDTLISCETQCNDRGLNTDHVVIVTKLDVTMCRTLETVSNNFRNIYW